MCLLWLPLITGEGRAHHGEILATAAALAEAGKLKPLLNERRFSTAEIGEAHDLVEAGRSVRLLLRFRTSSRNVIDQTLRKMRLR